MFSVFIFSDVVITFGLGPCETTALCFPADRSGCRSYCQKPGVVNNSVCSDSCWLMTGTLTDMDCFNNTFECSLDGVVTVSGGTSLCSLNHDHELICGSMELLTVFTRWSDIWRISHHAFLEQTAAQSWKWSTTPVSPKCVSCGRSLSARPVGLWGTRSSRKCFRAQRGWNENGFPNWLSGSRFVWWQLCWVPAVGYKPAQTQLKMFFWTRDVTLKTWGGKVESAAGAFNQTLLHSIHF